MNLENVKLFKCQVLTKVPQYGLNNMLCDLRLVNTLRGLRFEGMIDTYTNTCAEIARLKKLFTERDQATMEGMIEIRGKFAEHASRADEMFRLVQMTNQRLRDGAEFRRIENTLINEKEHQEANYKTLEHQLMNMHLESASRIIPLLDTVTLRCYTHYQNLIVIAKSEGLDVHLLVIVDIQAGKPDSRAIQINLPPVAIAMFENNDGVHLLVADEASVACYVFGLQQRLIFTQPISQVESMKIVNKTLVTNHNGKLQHWDLEVTPIRLLVRQNDPGQQITSQQNDGDQEQFHDAIEDPPLSNIDDVIKQIGCPSYYQQTEDLILFINDRNQISAIDVKTQAVHHTVIPINLEIKLFVLYKNKLILGNDRANLYHIDNILAYFN